MNNSFSPIDFQKKNSIGSIVGPVFKKTQLKKKNI